MNQPNAPFLAERFKLSPREAQLVAQLAATGDESEDIGIALGIAAATVRTHIRHVMWKLEAHTRAGIVVEAWRAWSEREIAA